MILLSTSILIPHDIGPGLFATTVSDGFRWLQIFIFRWWVQKSQSLVQGCQKKVNH